MDLLSNRVWDLFISRIDGKSKGKAWELKVTNGGERVSTYLFFVGLKGWRKQKTVLGERERYKYLPSSQLSDKSQQCRGLSAA